MPRRRADLRVAGVLSALLVVAGLVMLGSGAWELAGQGPAASADEVVAGLISREGVTAPTGQAAKPGQQRQPAALAKAEPDRVEIPKIGATSSLMSLGLKQDKTIEAPPVDQPMQAGWFSKGPTPGELGPAVVLGHIDGSGNRKGIFYRLRDVRAGDEVLIHRKDGSTARFVVQRTKQVPKAQFPTDEVYGNTAGPELRLITCGGAFDRANHSYLDNTIVFATLAA